MTVREALNSALDEELARDDSVTQIYYTYDYEYD